MSDYIDTVNIEGVNHSLQDTPLTTAFQGFVDSSDYSLEEIDTGQKWINGKSIYKCTIRTGAITESAGNLDTGIPNINLVISFEMILIDSSSLQLCYPLHHDTQNYMFSLFSFFNLNQPTSAKAFYTKSSLVSGTYTITDSYLTIRYIKTTD